jgi:hypothetical protein
MSDKVSGSGDGTARHYNRSDSPHGKKDFPGDHTADPSKSSHESSGYTYPFVEKMFPGINPADAKKFVDNLFNQINQQIKKAIEKSKENRQRWQEENG